LCCSSTSGAEKLAPLLRGFFTGIYFVDPEEMAFDESIAMWTMFYLKKPMENPHQGRALRDSINAFFDQRRPLLRFQSVWRARD